MELPPADLDALPLWIKGAVAVGVALTTALTAVFARAKAKRDAEVPAPVRTPSLEETAIVAASAEARVRALEAEAARLRLSAEFDNLRQDLSDLLGATRQSVRDMLVPLAGEVTEIQIGIVEIRAQLALLSGRHAGVRRRRLRRAPKA